MMDERMHFIVGDRVSVVGSGMHPDKQVDGGALKVVRPTAVNTYINVLCPSNKSVNQEDSSEAVV